ncbi:MAG TPA: TetR/AcrR family transcriptional regulator [Xanthobacteraceae bacterium]|nr:TetR/AcrR family transcriptional regulator [Xanthobacteraceae bacterium]
MTATKRKIPVPAGSANREKILSARAIRSAARREAILGAALDEFSARGFAAARLDDVAKRAGVAKGTIYLHFRDKEALFQEIVRSVMGPFVGTVEGVFASDIPLRTLADHMVELFSREVFGTRRKDIIRLIMTEGPRFPKLAEFYYREVLSRILKGARARLARGVERGEIQHAALARFPQIVAAPALVAIIWTGLFDRFEPLDVRELLRTHMNILFGERKAA